MAVVSININWQEQKSFCSSKNVFTTHTCHQWKQNQILATVPGTWCIQCDAGNGRRGMGTNADFIHFSQKRIYNQIIELSTGRGVTGYWQQLQHKGAKSRDNRANKKQWSPWRQQVKCYDHSDGPRCVLRAGKKLNLTLSKNTDCRASIFATKAHSKKTASTKSKSITEVLCQRQITVQHQLQ